MMLGVPKTSSWSTSPSKGAVIRGTAPRWLLSRSGATAARRIPIGRLVVEALEAHNSETDRRVFDRITVVCSDGRAAMKRYRLETKDGKPSIEFSFEGDDERDPCSGRGWAVLDDDDALRGRLFIHRGDDSAFEAERDNAAGTRPKPRRRRGGG